MSQSECNYMAILTSCNVSKYQSHTGKDFVFLARLVAYWPAPIHSVALPAYTVLTWLPAGQQCATAKGVLFLARLQPSRQPRFVDNNRDTVLLMEKN